MSYSTTKLITIFTLLVGVTLSYIAQQDTNLQDTTNLDIYTYDKNVTCSLCKEMLTQWQKMMNSTIMEERLDRYVEYICRFSIIYKDMCKQISQQYFERILYLVNHTNVEVLCEATLFC
ncbi:unnamed protein product [Heterobilharzia americana]|nr:unnamed protein product [Heterobilharzia americana]CAH8513443.1 unnamed protein product [Heterobilharzia americana]